MFDLKPISIQEMIDQNEKEIIDFLSKIKIGNDETAASNIQYEGYKEGFLKFLGVYQEEGQEKTEQVGFMVDVFSFSVHVVYETNTDLWFYFCELFDDIAIA